MHRKVNTKIEQNFSSGISANRPLRNWGLEITIAAPLVAGNQVTNTSENSLRKQPFLLFPRCLGRFARRDVYASTTEIAY